MATLALPGTPADLDNPNVVKVVCDLARARALLLARRQSPTRAIPAPDIVLRHVGLYGFQREALLAFTLAGVRSSASRGSSSCARSPTAWRSTCSRRRRLGRRRRPTTSARRGRAARPPPERARRSGPCPCSWTTRLRTSADLARAGPLATSRFERWWLDGDEVRVRDRRRGLLARQGDRGRLDRARCSRRTASRSR